MHLCEALLPLGDLIALCALLVRAACGISWGYGCLRQRYARVVGREARNTNVVITFYSWESDESMHIEADNRRTKVKLQIPHFKGVATSVFREATAEIRDGINKLVCDVQKQLPIFVICMSSGRSPARGSTHIFDFWFYLDIRIYTRNQVLDSSTHALVPRSVLPARTRILLGIGARVISTPRNLRRSS